MNAAPSSVRLRGRAETQNNVNVHCRVEQSGIDVNRVEGTPDSPTYDVVIIGGGTAGCVLASRLSENSELSICVLEAGDDHSDDERVYVPGLSAELVDSEVDWRYESTTQTGLNGRSIKHARGKIIGGSSAINSFALLYPSAAGFDAWAWLGNKGWGWFQRVNQPSPEVDADVHYPHINAGSGPLQAAFPRISDTLTKAWVDTWANLGLGNRADPLDGAALGGYISTCHITSTRERSHAGDAFLERARGCLNLHVVTGALVGRIVFSTERDIDAVATGVQFTVDGISWTVGAQKEVLLAASAFGSPQILELSGIASGLRCC